MKVKMTYEKPTVQKVEFDFKTRIAASGCGLAFSPNPPSACFINWQDS